MSEPIEVERSPFLKNPKLPQKRLRSQKAQAELQLAEMNRKNKSKKNKEEPSSVSDWNIDPGYVIGAIGVILAAGSLYLQWKEKNKPAPIPAVTPSFQQAQPPPPKSRIPEME